MISPDAAKKLERISRIQESMQALERELEELLGGRGPLPLTILDKEKPNGGKGRPKSDRRCGNCQEKGHQARTCPKKNVMNKPSNTDGALDEDEFWEVKSKKSQGIRIPEIATLMEKDEAEVSKAYAQGSYELYLKSR